MQGGTAARADGTVNTAGVDFSELRIRSDNRLRQLEDFRYTWWVHWREIADYILPRRYRWLITPNQWNRGSPINQRIIDNTATRALRNLAAGMMSGVTSPSRPWFRLTVSNEDIAGRDEVRLWLDDTAERMRKVMAASNYYTAKAMQFVDLGCFGTAPMLIYEDIGLPSSNIIRCFNPCAGEYFCAVGPNFTVDTLARKFVLTIDQTVREFGIYNVGPDTRTAYEGQGANLDREIIVAHMIEPNPNYNPAGGPAMNGLPAHFAFRELYWEWGASAPNLLRYRGFFDQPFSVPRWDVNGNDPYGRSPGMDALGDVKQLQVQQKRKSEGINKMVNPPMLADVSMKNLPASLLSGDVTYVANTNGVGFKPVFETRIPVEEISKDIAEVQERIRDTFFNDLFLMISNLDTVRSATEIEARREEKLMMLGPVLERYQNESLSPDIVRIYRIMMRNGLFAPVPDALLGAVVQPVYVSSLADMQRATITTAIERLVAFVGSLTAVDASAPDKVDFDTAIDMYGDALHVPQKVIRTGRVLQQVRDARAQQDQQLANAQTSQALVQGAQTLSQTEVGGGQNALQMILNGPAAGSA